MNQNDKIANFAKVAAKLLSDGDVDSDDALWNDVLQYQIPLIEYFEKIGLALIVDKDNGFAFLRQIELDESGKTIGIVKRMPLGYEVSIICVLLREWLEEHDVSETLSPKLYITHDELKDRIEIFFKEKSNQVKFFKDLDSNIRKIAEIGFLKKNDEKQNTITYQVKPILKAKISIEQLEEFKNQLAAYAQSQSF